MILLLQGQLLNLLQDGHLEPLRGAHSLLPAKLFDHNCIKLFILCWSHLPPLMDSYPDPCKLWTLHETCMNSLDVTDMTSWPPQNPSLKSVLFPTGIALVRLGKSIEVGSAFCRLAAVVEACVWSGYPQSRQPKQTFNYTYVKKKKKCYGIWYGIVYIEISTYRIAMYDKWHHQIAISYWQSQPLPQSEL